MIGILKINKYRKLQNPCSICLVKPVCNKWCDNKYGYYEKKLRYLKVIQSSVAPVAVVICLLLVAFGPVLNKNNPNTQLLVGIATTISVLVFIGGYYLDTYYLYNKIQSTNQELNVAIFERDWE